MEIENDNINLNKEKKTKTNIKEEKNSNDNNNNKDEESNKKEKEEEEEKCQEENNIKEKINSVPIMMRCFLCEDFCEEATQTLCCNEIFCKKHISEEILKNFSCPNCHKKCGLNNIIENKKLADDIKWFKKMLIELVMGNNNVNHNS